MDTIAGPLLRFEPIEDLSFISIKHLWMVDAVGDLRNPARVYEFDGRRLYV